MGHSSEKRWGPVSQEVSQTCLEVVDTLNRGEERFLQLLEVYAFAGNTDETWAALLFKEDINARGDTSPTAEEIAMAVDLKNALLSVHELWQAANNVTVTAAPRLQLLRRMI